MQTEESDWVPLLVAHVARIEGASAGGRPLYVLDPFKGKMFDPPLDMIPMYRRYFNRWHRLLNFLQRRIAPLDHGPWIEVEMRPETIEE
jgi:hypothetical protein